MCVRVNAATAAMLRRRRALGALGCESLLVPADHGQCAGTTRFSPASLSGQTAQRPSRASVAGSCRPLALGPSAAWLRREAPRADPAVRHWLLPGLTTVPLDAAEVLILAVAAIAVVATRGSRPTALTSAPYGARAVGASQRRSGANGQRPAQEPQHLAAGPAMRDLFGESIKANVLHGRCSPCAPPRHLPGPALSMRRGGR
jgi:hypothetical protein